MLATMSKTLTFPHFTFEALQRAEGLHGLDQYFLKSLQEAHPEWHQALLHYRHAHSASSKIEISELLINCAVFLEQFLAEFFHIEEAVAAARVKTTEHNPIAVFKKYFVQRRARRESRSSGELPSFQTLDAWLTEQLKTAPIKAEDRELSIALLGTHYLETPDTNEANINTLVQWCIQALNDPSGQAATRGWTMFHLPERLDPAHLIQDIHLRHREGFDLTDERMGARETQDEVNYCIYCHDHEGDFCSKGFPVKKGEPALGFKKNALAVTLTGCPLEEKVSEMQWLKQKGYTIASLAMVMVDNPLCPATGHRICNDCMKACIYQKQTPVNIPQIETRVLTDVLHLPWGVEIYDLLTRWNPLRHTQWAMKPYNGFKVLIAGMGPAGFTLAHHLLLEGFAVVGCDGLKIEPLPESLITTPVYRYADLEERLSERIMMGFGGVAEYGITARWDKNFLKLIYLSLMRRPYFKVFGCVRFGGTLTVEEAWALRFDHFVIAVGAGLPKALNIPNSLAPGMRQANDFLMALHLGNAAKASSLANLQVRLPALIIGSGLTGVDTATEVQAYYLAQVEKVNKRYQALIAKYGEEAICQTLDPASRETLAEYLNHAAQIAEERIIAAAEKRQPDFIKLIRAWGGVSIVYRRSMQASNAYVLNHEELKKALEEGIYYLEGLEPLSVTLDQYGETAALVCQATNGETKTLPAKAIFVATGTRPNTAYEFEHQGTFKRKNMQYQHYDIAEGEWQERTQVEHCKITYFGPFTSYHKDDHCVSLVGDTHPVFHGSVVKAIASGMRTYPFIAALFANRKDRLGQHAEYQAFAAKLAEQFHAEVLAVTRKTKTVLEITVRAPLAAKHFKPGQFYRLQNFETFAPTLQGTLMQIEPLALPAAECNKAQGTLTFIVREQTTAAKLCVLLKPGEPIALMGPTGVRAHIPETPETILIVGDSSSFAFARSAGPALKAAGNRVIYICYYQNKADLYCYEQLEQAVDTLILQRDIADAPHTAQPLVLSALLPEKTLADIQRVFVVGDVALLRAFQTSDDCKKTLTRQPKIYGSVYGSMQCMLKGVCAQCLQWQIDPATGKRTKAVFACSWQNQPLELIDMDHASERARQNRLMEHLNQWWVRDILIAPQDDKTA